LECFGAGDANDSQFDAVNEVILLELGEDTLGGANLHQLTPANTDTPLQTAPAVEEGSGVETAAVADVNETV
jgi:hypothetical protein